MVVASCHSGEWCRPVPFRVELCRPWLITQRSQVQILPPLPESAGQDPVAGRGGRVFDLQGSVVAAGSGPGERHEAVGPAEISIAKAHLAPPALNMLDVFESWRSRRGRFAVLRRARTLRRWRVLRKTRGQRARVAGHRDPRHLGPCSSRPRADGARRRRVPGLVRRLPRCPLPNHRNPGRNPDHNRRRTVPDQLRQAPDLAHSAQVGTK